MVARVGRRSAACDELLARLGSRTGAFVTAWNPLGRRRPLGWNRRMQAGLLAVARRLPLTQGRGTALRGSWFEEHLLIAADPRRLIVLARRFRQRAIVVVTRDRPARLTFVHSFSD